MKKNLIIIAFVIVPTLSDITYTVYGGYGIPLRTDYMGSNLTKIDSTSELESDPLMGSLGKGAKVGIHLDNYFSKNLGITLSAEYSFPSQYTTTCKLNEYEYQNILTFSSMRIAAGIACRVPLGNRLKWNFITSPSFAILIPLETYYDRGSMQVDVNFNPIDDSITRYSYTVTSRSIGFGAVMPVGVSYRLTKKVSLELMVSPTFIFTSQAYALPDTVYTPSLSWYHPFAEAPSYETTGYCNIPILLGITFSP